MDMKMTKPCEHCPFRTDCLKGWLGESRAQEIADSLLSDQSFPCHKTTEFDDEGTHIEKFDDQHCAGAMIVLEKMGGGYANQMMRIMERLGAYDRRKLDMAAPVFNDLDEFVEHHTEE